MTLLSIVTYFLLVGLVSCQERSLAGGSRTRNRFPAGKSEVGGFTCPEDFGYYPHPADCTQYYVCVFGGALQESCTGGLVYSNDLQTCDWPRNVVCHSSSQGVSTVLVTDPRTAHTTSPSVPNNHISSRRSNRNSRKSSPVTSLFPAFDEFDRSGTVPGANDLNRINAHFQSGIISPVQESSSRSVSVVDRTPRLQPQPVFPPSLPGSHTSTRLLPHVSVTTPNSTEPEYYYYYDDILYDEYYEEPPAASTTTTRKPQLSQTSSFRGPAASISDGSPTRSRDPKPSSKVVFSSPFLSQGGSSHDSPSPPQKSKPPKPHTFSSGNRNPSVQSSGPPTVVPPFPSRLDPVYPQPLLDSPATKCDPQICRLPDCYCGGKDVPGGFAPQDIPQLVMLTFDDSVNDLNKKLYRDLFENGRKNPNGCPITSTMYVSHEWTDYSQVQNLYADGHEIASHSITHSFGEQFPTEKWASEISGQRDIISAYAGVKMADVRGMRAPFLSIGGNKMFRMLYEQNFTYDSSMPIYQNLPPSFPYTMDYKVFHDCMIPPCPTNSYPGIWEIPMVMWVDLNGGRCSMGDACTTPPDAEGVYKMLIKNFERHYTSNRAPLGLYYHAAWFTTAHHKEGFIAFLDTISAMDDVWLVTSWQTIQWMRDPQPLSTVKKFPPFGCHYPDRPGRCSSPKVCNVWHKGSLRYLKTCQRCPEEYPWVGKTGLKKSIAGK